MPYLFPYEDVFVWGVGFLILGLLYVRWTVSKRQESRDRERKPSDAE